MRQHLTFPVRELHEATEAEAESTIIGSIALMMTVWPDLNVSTHPVGALAVCLDEDLQAGLFYDHFEIHHVESEARIYPKSVPGEWFINQYSALEKHIEKYHRHPFPEVLRSLSRIGEVGRLTP